MCPFWEYLDEIFTPKTSLNPVALYESGKQNLKSEMEESELIIDDNVELDFSLAENDVSMDANTSFDTSDMFDILNQPGTSQNSQNSDDTDSQFALTKRLQKKPRANQNSSTALLLEITKMRQETTKEKLQLEAQKVKLEEKRLDQEYEIRKIEAEARKMEAENRRMQLMQNIPANGQQRQNDSEQ